MRKMDDILVNLFDFTPDLVTGLQMQLDSFTGVLLEDAENGLSGQAGTDSCNDDDSEKKRIAFHIDSFWVISETFASK